MKILILFSLLTLPLLAQPKRLTDAQVRTQAVSGSIERSLQSLAAAAVQNTMDNDPDQSVRRNAVNALKSLPNAEGIPLLIQAAKSHRDLDTRKRAMTALGQTRDPRATAYFEEVLQSR
ncbi:MAG: HEAT repeat domain-containing protein [Acidimicrobiia bacterium]|nr:HEAT repeat domain-containing protein [Acidimicrobiia bacterium]